jgi:hypothetical protein
MVRKPRTENNLASYEIGTFINSILKYTTSCENSLGVQNIQELINSCQRKVNCLDERDSCLVLNETLNYLINSSWNIGQQAAVKGYKFSIKSKAEELVLIQKGNQTTSFKTSTQPINRAGQEYNVSLRLYG